MLSTRHNEPSERHEYERPSGGQHLQKGTLQEALTPGRGEMGMSIEARADHKPRDEVLC